MAHLKKPSARLHKSFLYLNGDEVINSLSAIEGGDVDEILIRTGQEGASDKSAELDLKVARGKGGKRKAQRFEEEMKRKRTTHSAATALLRKLHDGDAIGVIEGDYDETVYGQLEDHMMLEFDAALRVHPLHQTLAAGRTFLDVGASFGADKAQVAEMRPVIEILGRLSQAQSKERKTILLFADTSGTTDGYRLVLPVYEQHLLVPLDELSGRATFVAQVDRILRDEDQLLAMRLLRDAPLLPLEQEGLLEALPSLVDAISELGITASEDEFVLEHPAVVLKPICIYK